MPPNWPHPSLKSNLPDDAALLDLLNEWAGSEVVREKILVEQSGEAVWFLTRTILITTSLAASRKVAIVTGSATSSCRAFQKLSMIDRLRRVKAARPIHAGRADPRNTRAHERFAAGRDDRPDPCVNSELVGGTKPERATDGSGAVQCPPETEMPLQLFIKLSVDQHIQHLTPVCRSGCSRRGWCRAG